MKTFATTTLAAAILALTAVQALFAQDAPQKDAPKPDATKKQPAPHPVLGVYVSSAHPALASNLGDLLSPDQGLIVEAFPESSPAARLASRSTTL